MDDVKRSPLFGLKIARMLTGCVQMGRGRREWKRYN